MMMLIRLAHRYRAWAERSPWVANCSVGVLIAAAGDVLCQKYFPHPQPPPPSVQVITTTPQPDKIVDYDNYEWWWDPKRTWNLCVLRCGVITPFVLKWYPTLLRLCPGSTPLRVLGRIVIDQAVGSPSCIALVYVCNAVLQGDSWSEFTNRLREQFAVTWLRGLQYWPFVHAVNFGFVPLVYQPLFATVCSVYWNAVISYYTTFPQAAVAVQIDEKPIER